MASKDKRETTAAKLKLAKQKLNTLTNSLVKRYAIDGLIDEDVYDFAHEYEQGVKKIMRPFASAKDADGLAELSVVRLAQLRRVSIDDEGAFFDQELASISMQLDQAFDYGNKEQRGRLLASLATYLKESLGGRRSWLCGYERDIIEDFIFDTFAQESEFSSDVIELADWYLDKVASGGDADGTGAAYEGDPDGGHAIVYESVYGERTRAFWALTRMSAMAARGDSSDALYAYAEKNELLPYTEALDLIAATYETEGFPRKAISLLRENADAIDMIQPTDQEYWPAWQVGRMLDLAWRYYSKEELAELYCELLLNETYLSNNLLREWSDWRDVARLYDELHGLVGEPAWTSTRKKLLSSASDHRKRIFLGHERNIRELGKRMIAHLGNEFPEHRQYKASCPEMGPLYPAAYYLRYAELYMRKANTFKDYLEVAMSLSCAARLCGEYKLAQEVASEIATAHSRKRTLLKELREEGFDV